jgi:hypothetical protein
MRIRTSVARRIGGSKHGAVAVAALFALLAAPASAAPPSSWAEQADEIAAPWPGFQEADGRFRDYVLARDPSDGRDDYGEPMLGYGLLLTAARTGDAAKADAGLRALEYSLDHPARSPSTQVFHQLAVASAYNLARERFGSHPVFQRARSRWEDVLRQIAVYRIGRRDVTNKSIVESVLLLELVRSGLSSSEQGAALHDNAATLALVKRFLGTGLPRAAKPYESGGRAVLGDLPLLPPSYHALSVGMLARAVSLLGAEASSKARSLLRRAANASVAATAPDGSVAHHGRSQEQAWTLTLTAYGAELAALQPGASSRAAGYRGLSRRVLERLDDAYSSGPEGFLVTPSLARDIEDAIPGIDEYAAAAPYVGLTLASLEWAIAQAGDGSAGRIGADRSGSYVLGTGPGSWATARTGHVWFAVKRSRTSVRDLRYDFGLVALKVREGGRWRDVLPLRPRTVAGAESAGPALGSVPADGTQLLRGKGSRIVARGGFRTAAGRWVRRAAFTFAPVSCGVRLTFPGRAGDRYSYSGFFRRSVARSGRAVQDSDQRIRFDSAPALSLFGEFASGADVGLVRGRARFGRSRPGTVAIEICAR